MSVSAQPWATIKTSNDAEQGLEQGEEKTKQTKHKGKNLQDRGYRTFEACALTFTFTAVDKVLCNESDLPSAKALK